MFNAESRTRTRQDCPLSPFLFLAIEPLAVIHSRREIQDIHRGRPKNRLSLYAEDLLLYIPNPLKSLPVILQVWDNFGIFSGHKINLYKSKLFLINNGGFPLRKVKGQFKYLGICITRIFENLLKTSFHPFIKQVKTTYLNRPHCYCYRQN